MTAGMYCRRGHNLRVDSALTTSGQCRLCKRRADRESKHRQRPAVLRQGQIRGAIPGEEQITEEAQADYALAVWRFALEAMAWFYQFQDAPRQFSGGFVKSIRDLEKAMEKAVADAGADRTEGDLVKLGTSDDMLMARAKSVCLDGLHEPRDLQNFPGPRFFETKDTWLAFFDRSARDRIILDL